MAVPSSVRQVAGVLLYDALPFAFRLMTRWTAVRNRDERVEFDGRGVRCLWKFGSDLHIVKVLPSAATRLMRKALREWPISFAGGRPSTTAPDITFLVGHRGLSRLPHLLLTLRSIAAQCDARVECVVIEQSAVPEIRESLPSWVRYLHQPVSDGEPYRRAATFNAGAAVARGRLLVLHDNDMLVPERYSSEILSHAREGWEVIDLKRFIFYLTKEDSARALESQYLSLEELSENVIQNLHGGSLAITAEAYAAIGGFDESFVGWGGEDVELWERAETRRATCFGYLPFIHLWHEAQPEKLQVNDAPAVQRYYELAAVPVAERIARLQAQRSVSAIRADANDRE